MNTPSPARRVLVLALSILLTPATWAEVLWSQPRDFYVDPPQGWSFVEDPTPEHFVLTDPGRRMILEIFSQDKGDQTDLGAKAADLKKRLGARGDEETFTWNGRPAWLADLRFRAGPVQARGWALVADDGTGWVSALAYAPEEDYEKAADTLVSTLNSLALGLESRRHPGPLSTFFQATAARPRTETKAVAGLTPPLELTYNLDLDEAVRATMERETRMLTALLGPQVKDQGAIAPGWSRFYRQIYREFFDTLEPVAREWEKRLAGADPTARAQAVLAWLQGYEYERKGGLTDLSTPWETLRGGAGDCDSLSLVYLAIMEHLGVKGILMVSAPYSHGMAALDLPGAGARMPFEGKGWLVAELTDKIDLGLIAADKADPNQWIALDLWGYP